MTRLERLTEDGWRTWRALRLRALAEDPQAFASSTAAWTGPDDVEDRWRGRIRAASACFVAHLPDAGDDAVAMVAADRDDDGGGLVLASMWVAPEGRGRGVGRALVEAVLDHADGADVHLRVMDGNEPAVATYRAAGFVLDPGAPDEEGCRTMRRPAVRP